MFYRIDLYFTALLIALIVVPARDTVEAKLRVVRVAVAPPLAVSHRRLWGTNVFQRCAGSVDYLIRDNKGEIVSASKITITVLPIKGYEDWGYGRHSYRSTHAFDIKSHSRGSNPRGEMDSEPESLVFGTGCSRPLISVKLEYRKATMVLHFKNVPRESNFYVDSPPFQEGEFEIDLKPVFDPAYSQPPRPIEEMDDEEKDKNIYLKELKDAIVISSKKWKKVK
jgi:hypothetical protein